MSNVLHHALVRTLSKRVAAASLAELRVLERVLDQLEIQRRDRWERRLATGPGDVDRSFHLVHVSGGSVCTLCNGRWDLGDAVETQAYPTLGDRCPACLRRAGRNSMADALIYDVEAEIAAEDRAAADRQAVARALMAEYDEPSIEILIDDKDSEVPR